MVDPAEVARLVLCQPKVARAIDAARLDPEDIVQEACLRLVRAQQSERSRWCPERGLSRTSYLYRVGGHAALNAARKARRFAVEVPTVGAPEAPAFPDDDPLADAMALLDLDEERVMARHLAEGRTLAEIREAMDIPAEAARELRERVRALLLPLRD